MALFNLGFSSACVFPYTFMIDHTGMCSSLYSSWPSSSKFGSASSESSCKREQKVGRGREADSPPPAPQLLLGPAALTAPRPLQASLSTGTVAPGWSTSLWPKPWGHPPAIPPNNNNDDSSYHTEALSWGSELLWYLCTPCVGGGFSKRCPFL